MQTTWLIYRLDDIGIVLNTKTSFIRLIPLSAGNPEP